MIYDVSALAFSEKYNDHRFLLIPENKAIQPFRLTGKEITERYEPIFDHIRLLAEIIESKIRND